MSLHRILQGNKKIYLLKLVFPVEKKHEMGVSKQRNGVMRNEKQHNGINFY